MTPYSAAIGPDNDDERIYQEESFAQICALIEEASSIALCAHTAPDGDALGSVLALQQIIDAQWPHKHVVSLLADSTPVPRIYQFLPGSDQMVYAAEYHETPDLFVAVDLSVGSRLNDGQAVLNRSRRVAVIDHHPDGEIVADAMVIRPSASAAGVLVTEFSLYCHLPLTESVSQCLMCAIMTDTGRFQYQNTDAETLKVASLLVDHGASPSQISLNVYQSFRIQYLHLKSLVLGRICTFEDGRIAYSYATQSDLKRTGADLDECDGLIDAVRSVEGSEIALFLKAVPGGKVRGNLRSKGRHDVSKVARLIGGGGHRAAAGFTYVGDIDEALTAVLPSLRALINECTDTDSNE